MKVTFSIGQCSGGELWFVNMNVDYHDEKPSLSYRIATVETSERAVIALAAALETSKTMIEEPWNETA